MKQVIQNVRTGQLTLESIPAPLAGPGQVLIANRCSLISAGTEKMIMDLSRKSLLGKARERPDHVRRVLEKVRNEGLLPTIRQVRQKLDEPLTMGYSSAGVVLACGEGVQEFKPGDRAASNGPHAEIVSVPRNLCARVPDAVTWEQASFGVLGSIALQGVRLTLCELGETVLVIGLGLVGQLCVGLLRAAGINAIGADPDLARCELAKRMGAGHAANSMSAGEVHRLTGGLGVDAVIIAASTKSNAPMQLAADAVRKKGRVVLVGVVGLELDRRPFYFKEAEFVVSCSYGPGRYDPDYEDRGHDYPPAYVRWTEQRNIQAVLDLIAQSRLTVDPLISHRFSIDDAERAYQLIDEGKEPFLGIVLEYPEHDPTTRSTSITFADRPAASGVVRCGILGAGNFAKQVLIPVIEKSGRFQIAKICSAKGVSATHTAKKVSAAAACTDENEIFDDPQIDTIFSLTRHDQHARHVVRAIRAGKNIFVEKPLCLSEEELKQIVAALDEAPQNEPLVMVGFNRRFSPAAREIRSFFAGAHAPLTVTIRFNAGEIPADHWTQNEAEGGGRIIGEACHAIDLATYLIGSPPVRVFAESVGGVNPRAVSDDQCAIVMRHADGSVSNIGYYAGGDKSFPKERVEVFGGGRVGVIDDFRSVTTCRGGKSRTTKMQQNKGHAEEIAALAESLRTGKGSPIPWSEIYAVTLASILAVRSLREGVPFEIT